MVLAASRHAASLSPCAWEPMGFLFVKAFLVLCSEHQPQAKYLKSAARHDYIRSRTRLRIHIVYYVLLQRHGYRARSVHSEGCVYQWTQSASVAHNPAHHIHLASIFLVSAGTRNFSNSFPLYLPSACCIVQPVPAVADADVAGAGRSVEGFRRGGMLVWAACVLVTATPGCVVTYTAAGLVLHRYVV